MRMSCFWGNLGKPTFDLSFFYLNHFFMTLTNSLFDSSIFSNKRIRKGAVRNSYNLAFQNHIPVNNVKPTKEAERQK